MSQFIDNSGAVKTALEDSIRHFLHEAGGEVVRATKRNSRTRTGGTKNSWRYEIEGKTVTIGNPEENAIWEEFGTGEYAMNGGRQGGWVYYDEVADKFYRTNGKTPTQAFQKGIDATKPKLERRLGHEVKIRVGRK